MLGRALLLLLLERGTSLVVLVILVVVCLLLLLGSCCCCSGGRRLVTYEIACGRRVVAVGRGGRGCPGDLSSGRRRVRRE